MLDLVHPKDVDVVNNMLAFSPNTPAVGSASMYTGKAITGSKRSFYVRLKTSKQPSDSDGFPSTAATIRNTNDSDTIPGELIFSLSKFGCLFGNFFNYSLL